MKVRVGDLPGQCNYYCASYILGFNPEEERDKDYPKVSKLLEEKKIRCAKNSHLIDTYSILSYQREEEEVRLRLVEQIERALRELIEEVKNLREDNAKLQVDLRGDLRAIRADIQKLQIENVKKVRSES